jgi:hypothetical protein
VAVNGLGGRVVTTGAAVTAVTRVRRGGAPGQEYGAGGGIGIRRGLRCSEPIREEPLGGMVPGAGADLPGVG